MLLLCVQKVTVTEYVATFLASFSIVKEHIPFLSNVTYDQLMRAVDDHQVIIFVLEHSLSYLSVSRYQFLTHRFCPVSFFCVQNTTPSYLYDPPRLENVLPYFDDPWSDSELADFDQEKQTQRPKFARIPIMTANVDRGICFPVHEERVQNDNVEELTEERLNFIETLRYAYHRQIEQGDLEEHGGECTIYNFAFISTDLATLGPTRFIIVLCVISEVQYSLFQSLDFAENAATAGVPLNDWVGTQVASDTWVSFADKAFQTILRQLRHVQMCLNNGTWFDPGYFSVYLGVRQ